MSRPHCPRCLRPTSHCLCALIPHLDSRTRVYRYQPYLDLFHRDTVQSVFETQFTPEAP